MTDLPNKAPLAAPPPRITLPELPAAPPSLGGSVAFGVVVTLALMAAGWSHTFAEMWVRWFPNWVHANEPLYDRFTKGDSYYTHGPMVPVVSLVIAFLIYRRVGAPVRQTRGSNLTGWTVFLVSLSFHLLSAYARVMFVSGFAMIGVFVGLLMIWGGWPLLRAFWLPVAFLFFMVPLPMETIADLNYQLKTVASTIAVGLTNHVFSVPANLDGSFVHLMPGPDGADKTLVVEDVCSGLRSMISLISFAALFAVICRAKGFWRFVMLLMSVPVAIACNVVRITGLSVVAHYYGVDAAGPESWFHNFSGVMVFAVALAFLFGMEQVILAAGKLLKRNWSDPRLLGFLDDLPRGGTLRPATAKPSVLLLMCLTAGLSLLLAVKGVEMAKAGQAEKAVPATLVINGAEWPSEKIELDELTLTILETRDYVYRRYTDPRSRRSVDFMIVFSPDNRKGTHPPEVCLKGAGENVIEKQSQPVAIPRVGDANFRRLLTQRGDHLTSYLYVYKCGDSYTASFPVQQARIFLNSLLHRNAAGALIRFSVPIEGRNSAAAQKLALQAAQVLMPAVDRGLP